MALRDKQNRTRMVGQQTNTPYEPAVPIINDILQEAQGTYDATRGELTDPNYGAAQDYLGGVLGGDYLDVTQAPGFSEAWQYGADDVTNRMKTLYQGMGRYGSPDMNEALSYGLGRTYADIALPAYMNERGLQNQAAGMWPTYAAYNADAPWRGLQNYAGVLGNVTQGYGTTEMREPDAPRDRFRNFIDVGLDIAGTILGFKGA